MFQMLGDLWAKATSPDRASLFTGTHMLGSIYPRNDPHSFSARNQGPGNARNAPKLQTNGGTFLQKPIPKLEPGYKSPSTHSTPP